MECIRNDKKENVFLYGAGCNLLFTGCTESVREHSQIYESKEEEETGILAQESQLLQEKEVDFSNLKTDKGYKMFYGEWEVIRKVGENYRLATEDAGDMVGREAYFPNMPAMKELGLTGTYVTIISMEECGSNVHFIIKDDETLIMYYKNTYLEQEQAIRAEQFEYGTKKPYICKRIFQWYFPDG